MPYAYEPHAPGFHVPALRAAGKDAGTTTPALVVPQPHPLPPLLLPDSAAILRWVDARAPAAARLFPAAAEAEVEALCARLDAGIGVAARSFVYSHALDSPEIADALAPPNVPASERAAWRWGVGYLVRGLMRAGMQISAENGARALDTLRREFAALDALLADGRPYLAGESFTAADLTLAALAAPALGVPYGEHPPWRALEELPEPRRAAAAELRATAAGRLALRLWVEERWRVVTAAYGA